MNIDEILARLSDVKKNGNASWKARCPGHDDADPSLSVKKGDDGRTLLYCHSGCSQEKVVQALGLEMRDLFSDHCSPSPTHRLASRSPLTLSALAEDKKIPLEFLLSLGIEQRNGAVVIPYRNSAGHVVRERLRTALRAKDGCSWAKGDSVLSYGMDRLATAREAGTLAILEGETDTWSCWFNDIPALGIPGATMVNATLSKDCIEGINRAYVWQEPDNGGMAFVSSVGRKLREIGWKGKAFVIGTAGIKDPNDLWKKCPNREEFLAAWKAIIEAAVPLSIPLSESQVIQGLSLKGWLTKEIQPPTYIVESLFPMGLTLLVGAAKIGKTALALSAAFEVARGGRLWNQYDTTRGEVLYLMLEGGQAAIQQRLQRLVDRAGGSENKEIPSDQLFLFSSWPPLFVDGSGKKSEGWQELEKWLDEHQTTKMVVIDVLYRALPPGRRDIDINNYSTVYDLLVPFRELANSRRIAIVLVHHKRKPGKGGASSGDDPFAAALGSSAFLSAVDCAVSIERKRQTDSGVILAVGNSFEDRFIPVKFREGFWELDGDGSLAELYASAQERRILEILKTSPGGKKTADILREAGSISKQHLQNLLSRMERKGCVERGDKRGFWKYRK